MRDNPNQRAIAWPIRILIHLYAMSQSGYVRVTERDLVRQWENLARSIRTHLLYLQERGLVELSAVSAENCFVRLTTRGIDYVEAGIREAEAPPPVPNEEPHD